MTLDVEAVGCVSASLLDVAAVDPASAFVFSAKVNAEPSDITMRCIWARWQNKTQRRNNPHSAVGYEYQMMHKL